MESYFKDKFQKIPKDCYLVLSLPSNGNILDYRKPIRTEQWGLLALEDRLIQRIQIS